MDQDTIRYLPMGGSTRDAYRRPTAGTKATVISCRDTVTDRTRDQRKAAIADIGSSGESPRHYTEISGLK